MTDDQASKFDVVSGAAERPKKRRARRAISVRASTYEALQERCGPPGISISSFLEYLVANKLKLKTPRCPKCPLPDGHMGAHLFSDVQF